MKRLAAFALLLGAGCFFYRGPGRELIRGHLGDAAAAMLVYAVVGLAWRRSIVVRTLLAAGIVAAIELRQVLGHALPGLTGELFFGATFDPWDFLAYGLGLAAAVAWELRPRWRCATASPALRGGRSA